MKFSLLSPTSRKELKTGKRYTAKLGGGRSIEWRRANNGREAWTALKADGKGGQLRKHLGYDLSYEDASDRARTCSHDVTGLAARSADPPQTIDQALTSYEERLRRDRKKLSNATWLRGLFKPLLNRSLADITVDDFVSWQSGLLKAGKAETTINKAIGLARSAFKWAARDKRIAANADAWMKGLQRYEDAKVARGIRLTDARVREIVDEAYRMVNEFGVFVQMHADYGSRTSQLARIPVEQLQGNRIEIPGDKKGKYGNRKSRSFKVKPKLLAKLQAAAANQPPGTMLLRDERGEPWLRPIPGENEMEGDRHIVLFARLAAKLKLPTELRRGKRHGTTLYALRSASIKRMIDAGVPIKEIADIHFTGVDEIERHYHYDVAHDDASLTFDSSPEVVIPLPVKDAA